MVIGTVEVCPRALRQSGGQTARLGYLIETEILGHPVRHALVSLPLAWRGMFIGKRFWWGIAGWLLALWLFVRDLRRRDWAYPLLCLPAGFLVAFHAAVSISEMRYHATLVPVLAYALAVGLCLLLDRLRALAMRSPA